MSATVPGRRHIRIKMGCSLSSRISHFDRKTMITLLHYIWFTLKSVWVIKAGATCDLIRVFAREGDRIGEMSK